MESRTMLLLVATLCCCVNVAVGQYKQCTSHQRCVQFNDCQEFRNYVGKPPASWPRQIQDQVRQRVCKMETNGRSKIWYVCCEAAPVSPAPNQPTGLDLLDMKSCGKHSADRIAYGQNAKVFDYPWMALLYDGNDQIKCGGTLIAESYVLTAAHCDRPPIATVRLGENDITKDIDCNVYGTERDCADAPQNIPVAKFIKHNLHSPSKRKNDIALVKLAWPATLSYSVKTVCLPIGPMLRTPTPRDMIVSGWGYTEHGQLSSILQYAKLPLVPLDQCARQLTKLNDAISLDESQFCAGGQDKIDNCRGDSGGPLQYHSHTSATVQYGIVSFGLHSCGNESAPGVYTKVTHYMDWILKNLQ